ncbi:MAG: hypothetical protein RIC55_23490 [Pirellulaceae bacterium]
MPWYISLTMRWAADVEGESLQFLNLCEKTPIPSDQIRIPQISWHSTLFAVAEVRRVIKPKKTMHDSALLVLEQLRAQNIVSSLANLPKFRFHPEQIRHWDDGTAVQFKADNSLEQLRSAVEAVVSQYRLSLDVDDVRFPFNGGPKNAGNGLWGSIARTPNFAGKNDLRHEVEITGDFREWCFTARKAILTISDEALTNNLTTSDYDSIVLI